MVAREEGIRVSVDGVQEQLTAVIERFYNNRSLFAQEVFGITPWKEQEAIFAAADSGERRLAVKSGHRVGKSLGNALLLRHWQITRFPQKSAVTAPSERHLFDALWSEFRGLESRFTPDYQWLRGLYDTTQERSVFKARPAESFISIKVSRPAQTEALQGMYAPHVLMIADEASGIPDATFEAAMSSMANPEVLFVMTSQPIRNTGFFADAFLKNPELWWRRTISSLDSPYCGRDYIHFVQEKYGEDSNPYRIRILGEFPVSEEDKVIPRELVLAAMGRKVEVNPRAAVVWGACVGNVQRAALAKRRANGLLGPVLHWPKLDTMGAAGRIKQEWDDTPSQDRPGAICLDAIGIGRDVADRLRELDLPARAINIAEIPALIRTQYKNLQAELWFDVRNWLANRDTVLPEDDEELLDELSQPNIVYYDTGKTGIETKDSMSRRGMESPDLANAMAMTFAVNATVLAGQGALSSWKTPVRRIIRGLV